MAQRDDDERPKRSWREIDKMRDGTGSRRRSSEDRAQERTQRGAAYGQYKAQAAKLLGGAELPEALREKLDPTGELRARDELLKRVKKLAGEDRKGWAEAVREYVEKFELPDDAFLLTEWLDHPRDRIVEKALGKLEALVESGALAKKRPPAALEQRLRGLELTGGDPEVQQRARTLRERLR
jgi:hypothetical protein